MSNTYLATLSEVKAVVTSYMRITHDLSLEVDEVKLARLLTSVRKARAPEVTPEVTTVVKASSLEVKLLEVDGTRVMMRIPAGWPIMANDNPKRVTYVCAHLAGRPPVAKKLCDLEMMVTREAVTRTVRISKRVAGHLKAGLVFTLETLLSGMPDDGTRVQVAQGAEVHVAPPPEVTTVAALEVTKVVKLTRKDKRVAEHNAGACTCGKPADHTCPAVREEMLD